MRKASFNTMCDGVSAMACCKLHLFLVTVSVVVGPAEKAMSSHHPLLLDQPLEAHHGSAVWVTHHLDQAGDHAVHVPVFWF